MIDSNLWHWLFHVFTHKHSTCHTGLELTARSPEQGHLWEDLIKYKLRFNKEMKIYPHTESSITPEHLNKRAEKLKQLKLIYEQVMINWKWIETLRKWNNSWNNEIKVMNAEGTGRFAKLAVVVGTWLVASVKGHLSSGLWRHIRLKVWDRMCLARRPRDRRGWRESELVFDIETWCGPEWHRFWLHFTKKSWEVLRLRTYLWSETSEAPLFSAVEVLTLWSYVMSPRSDSPLFPLPVSASVSLCWPLSPLFLPVTLSPLHEAQSQL